MKNRIRNIILHCLACCVLISTTGTTFYRHFCNMSLQDDISVFEVKTCCGEELEAVTTATAADDEDSCCKLSFEFKKTDISPIAKFFKTKFAAYTPFLHSVFIRPTYRKSYYAVNVPATSFTDSSPPRSGRDIVIDQQNFRL